MPVNASDIRRVAEMIEAKLKRQNPHKGTWEELETTLDNLANAVYAALIDLDGDQ